MFIIQPSEVWELWYETDETFGRILSKLPALSKLPDLKVVSVGLCLSMFTKIKSFFPLELNNTVKYDKTLADEKRTHYVIKG